MKRKLFFDCSGSQHVMFRLLVFLLFLIAGLMVSGIPAYAAEYQITDDGLPKAYLSISGTRIVWMQEDPGATKDVYMYDYATGNKTKISTAGLADMSSTFDFDKDLDISGDLIVWRDQRIDADGDIYLVDLSKTPLTEIRISSDSADTPRFPAVDGNRIAWSEDGAYGFPDGLTIIPAFHQCEGFKVFFDSLCNLEHDIATFGH